MTHLQKGECKGIWQRSLKPGAEKNRRVERFGSLMNEFSDEGETISKNSCMGETQDD
jgi:hypothetical protein